MVLITAQFKSSDDQATGLELGADGYITRPIEKRELVARIDAFMRHKRTINDLRKSEARFQRIIDKNPDALLIVDKHGQVRFANLAAKNLFKLTIDDLLDRAFGYPIIKGEYTEIDIVRHDKEAAIAEMRTIDINWDEEPSFLTSIRDISERKKIEEALRENEENLKITLNSIGDAVVATDISGNIIRMNHVAEKLTGWLKTEAHGQPVTNIFHIVDTKNRERTENPVKKVLRTGQLFGLANDNLLIAKDGTEYKIADSAAPISDIYGNIVGVVMVFRDVTEEYALQQKIIESEKQFRNLFEQAGDGICLHDDEGNIVEANNSLCNLFGYTKEEFSEINIQNIHTQKRNARKIGKEAFEHLLKFDKVRFETEFVTKTGEVLIVEICSNAIEIEGRKVYQAIFRDVTKERETQEKLNRETKFTELALDAQMDTFFLFDPFNSKAIRWNNAFSKISGYSNEEIAILPVPESYYSKDDLKRANDFTQQLIKEGSGIIELELICKNGHKIPTEYQVTAIYNANNEVVQFVSVGRDITERKIAEKKIVESEQKYYSLFEMASDVILTVEPPDGRILDANFAAEQVLGYSKEELKQLDGFQIVAPELVQKTNEEWADQLNEKGQFNLTTKWMKKDGNYRHMLISGKPVRIKGRNYLQLIGKDITEQKNAEDAIHESRARLIVAQQIGRMGDFRWDIKSNEVQISEGLEDLLQYRKEEINTYERLNSLIHHPDDKEKINTWFTDCLQANVGRLSPLEYRVIREDGKTLHVRTMGVIEREMGRSVRIIGTILDITKRKKAELAVKESNERIRLLLDSTAEGIFGMDTDAKCTFINASCLNMLGYKSDEGLIGQNIHKLIHHTDQDDSPQDLKDSKISEAYRKGKGIHASNEVFWRKDGSAFPVEYWSFPIYKDGNLIGAVVNFNDITERKIAEEKLHYQAKLLENVSDAVISTDNYYRVLSWNKAAENLYGWKQEEVLGREFKDITPVIYLDTTREKVLDEFKENGRWSGEALQYRKNGKKLTIHASVTNFSDSLGNMIGTIAVNRDVTEKKQAEAALKISEQKFKGVFEHSNIAIALGDANGNLVDANKEFIQMLDYDRESLLNMNLKDFTHPDDLISETPLIEKLLNNEIDNYRIEKRYIKKSKEIVWVDIAVSARKNINGEVDMLMGMVMDITEKKLAQQELNKQKEMFELVINSVPTRIYWKDLNSTYLGCNSAFAVAAGKKNRKEVIGTNDFHLTWSKEADKYIRDDKSVMSSGIPKLSYDEDYTNSGGEKIWWRTSKLPLKNSNNEIIGILATSDDITERKKAEKALHESRELLLEAQKIAHIAHWTFNPITGIFRWSEELYRIYGRNPADGPLSYEEHPKLIHPDDWGWFDETIQNTAKNGAQFDIILRILRPDGSIRFINCICKPFIDNTGAVVEMRGTIQDVTERMQADETIMKSQKRYKALFDDSPVPLWEEDFTELYSYIDQIKSSGFSDLREYFNSKPNELINCSQKVKILDVNDSTLKLHEAKSKKDLVGNLKDIFTPKSVDVFKEEVIAIAEGKLEFEAEGEVKTLNGKSREIFLKLIINKEGETYKALLATIDITDRKKAERELKKYHEQLEKLVKERTEELEEKNRYLQRINDAMVDREFRIKELREEIKLLKLKLS